MWSSLTNAERILDIGECDEGVVNFCASESYPWYEGRSVFGNAKSAEDIITRWVEDTITSTQEDNSLSIRVHAHKVSLRPHSCTQSILFKPRDFFARATAYQETSQNTPSGIVRHSCRPRGRLAVKEMVPCTPVLRVLRYARSPCLRLRRFGLSYQSFEPDTNQHTLGDWAHRQRLKYSPLVLHREPGFKMIPYKSLQCQFLQTYS